MHLVIVIVHSLSQEHRNYIILRGLLLFGRLFSSLVNFHLAGRASVLSLEPRAYAVRMEPVQTRKDHVLFTNLVLALADGTRLILFAEVIFIRLSKFSAGQLSLGLS